ncbi:hypothetical protein MMAGJ_00020 [Mycolicibacterium mageritense]|uniref:Uncharacterized protein n=1 Tax=Mycolicibacterium mageritense TaxID=53462 RepID=A0ABM7HJQ8_MYCME|nr:hypothetical protein MMAGJ_00020 [Mycolicibacterium mageritense]
MIFVRNTSDLRVFSAINPYLRLGVALRIAKVSAVTTPSDLHVFFVNCGFGAAHTGTVKGAALGGWGGRWGLFLGSREKVVYLPSGIGQLQPFRGSCNQKRHNCRCAAVMRTPGTSVVRGRRTSGIGRRSTDPLRDAQVALRGAVRPSEPLGGSRRAIGHLMRESRLCAL